MHASAARLELRLPGCRSLKEKRRTLRPVLDHLRRRMELSTAEIDHQDAWQRATVGVAVVSAEPSRVDRIIDSVGRWIDEVPDVELVGVDVGHLEMP